MKWRAGPTPVAVAPPLLEGSSAIGLCSYTNINKLGFSNRVNRSFPISSSQNDDATGVTFR